MTQASGSLVCQHRAVLEWVFGVPAITLISVPSTQVFISSLEPLEEGVPILPNTRAFVATVPDPQRPGLVF